MNLARANWIRIALLALPLLICSGGGVWFGARQNARALDQREYLAARARWENRPFGDYRLVVDDGACTYDVTVRRGQIRGNYRDSCNLRAHTVEALFGLIDDDGPATPQCGVAGCLCETTTRVTVAYDATLGYPREVTIEALLTPNWRHPDLWRHLLVSAGMPACGGGGARTLKVLYVGMADE